MLSQMAGSAATPPCHYANGIAKPRACDDCSVARVTRRRRTVLLAAELGFLLLRQRFPGDTPICAVPTKALDATHLINHVDADVALGRNNGLCDQPLDRRQARTRRAQSRHPGAQSRRRLLAPFRSRIANARRSTASSSPIMASSGR